MTYARGTSVSSEATRMEIERTLVRYGASGFAYGWEPERALVGFRMKDRHIRFHLPMPDRRSRQVTHDGRGSMRSPARANAAFEQLARERWRALLLIIKAKLEAVQSQIVEFDDEFMAHVVMPDGRTVSEHTKDKIRLAYSGGRSVPLLPDFSASEP